MTTRILARFHRAELEAQQTDTLRQVLNETADPMPTRADREGATPGNERLLRGIPLFAPGVKFGGVIAGTQPEREALRRDGLRRRRA